ncbi:hypothetical protein BSKO_11140 [Bryopsis sp. KO-2023]|nr:hypothetical protein BSKO_11140 [Bryopsis sp. KO-2023]
MLRITEVGVVLAAVVFGHLCSGVVSEIHGVTFSAIFSTEDKVSQCLDEEALLRNLDITKSISKRIRMYSIAQCPQNTRIVLDYAKNNGMRVLLGLWISRNKLANANEFFWLDDFALEYKDILDAVIVGNEVIAIQKVPLDDLLAAIAQTRSILEGVNVQVPVTTALIWPVLEDIGLQIAQVTDFICMHVQPFWEGRTAQSSGQYAVDKAAEIEELVGKPVWICETGWPTGGEKCCENRPYAFDGFQAEPTLENAEVFLNDLVRAAKAANRPYFYHEAIDGDWKRMWSPCGECVGLAKDVPIGCAIKEECEVDYHWGLFTSKGVSKVPVP